MQFACHRDGIIVTTCVNATRSSSPNQQNSGKLTSILQGENSTEGQDREVGSC